MARARKRLADASELYIGPQTKRYRDVRRHLREASDALDRGNCVLATVHLRDVQDLLAQRGPDLGTATRDWFAEERARLKSSCRVNFAARTRKTSRRTRSR